MQDSRHFLFFLPLLILLLSSQASGDGWSFDAYVPSSPKQPSITAEKRKISRFQITNVGNHSTCTHGQGEKLAKEFKRLNLDHTNCPSEPWFLAMANADPFSRKTFVNIGANKGYNIALWMDSFIPSMKMTPKHWYEALMKRFPQLKRGTCSVCGCCDDCNARFDHSYDKHSTLYDLSRATHLDIIVADLNCDNLQIIKEVLDELASTSFPRLIDQTSIFSLCAGLSDKTGQITLPKCLPSSEVCGLNVKSSEMARRETTDQTMTVPLTTIDDIALQYILHRVTTYVTGNFSVEELHKPQVLHHRLQTALHKERNPSAMRAIEEAMNQLQYFHHISATKTYRPFLDFMIIDTEGFDYLVIQGGKQLLESRSLRAFIFEYHELPPWNGFKLEDTQRQLDAYGYECYVEGQTGLWPITGELCWHSIYEFHQWSNVFCVRREDLWFQTIQDFVVRQY